MKYELILRWVPDEKQPIQARHAEIVGVLDRVPRPWGFGGAGGPSAPEAGRELLAECRLDRSLGPGVRGSLIYRYRGGLADAGMYDDYLRFEFNPERVDYPVLVHSHVPHLLEDLQPYRMHLGPAELMVADFEALRRTDYRSGVHRFYPITYLGRQLCLRAFGWGPEELVRRLLPECTKAEVLADGALLVLSPEAVPTHDAQSVNKRAWERLGGEPQLA